MATEKRLIDANYLVNKLIPNCPIEEGGIPLGDFDAHQKILKLYPTVDAVEVVRCKDCFYHHYICPTGFEDRRDDDFCSQGARDNPWGKSNK